MTHETADSGQTLATTASFPEAILESMTSKYEEETRRKAEKEARAKKNILGGFESAYASTAALSETKGKSKVSLAGLVEKPADKPLRKKVSLDEL
jgi:hypothetical protein